MSADHPAGEPGADRSGSSLLFTMGGAMFVVTVLACVLIVVPSTLWLFVAYGVLVALVAAVGVFLARFIDSDAH